MRLWLAVWAGEVELGYQGFDAEADLDVADVPGGCVYGEEVSRHDGIGEAKGKGVLEGLDALDIPGLVLVVELIARRYGIDSISGHDYGQPTYHRLQTKSGERGDAKLGRRLT